MLMGMQLFALSIRNTSLSLLPHENIFLKPWNRSCFKSHLFHGPREVFKSIIQTCITNSCVLTWKGTPHDVRLPLNASFFCLILFPVQTILMILNHFCETSTSLSSLWSKEKIKREPTMLYPLVPSLFSDPCNIWDLSQYSNSLSCKNSRHWCRRQTQTFPLWLLPCAPDFLRATNLCLFNPFLGIISS